MVDQLNNVDACVFDAYGTLFDVAASARRCSEEIGERWLDFSAMWRKKQLEYTWLRSLMGDFKDFWHVTGDALDFTMETYNIYDPLLRSRLMERYLKLDAYPEVPKMLENLKERGIKTAILSNGSRTMLTSAVRKAGIENLLDHIISVDEIQVFKVHPSVYQLGCNCLDIPAERIAFQSANAWDVAGAASFGMQVVWVNRFAQKPEKLGELNKPTFEIRSLDRFIDLLGE